MAELAPEEPEDDVPAWVMTFSDVITLLMTFFILLLTFSSTTPETFDRMQISLFGHGGSSGFIADADGMVKDALLMRTRARTGRVSQDGSPIPPAYSDPDLETLDKGLAGLDEDDVREITTTHHIRQKVDSLVDAKGNLTSLGVQQMKMLSVQLRKRPLNVDFACASETEYEKSLKLIDHLMEKERIHPARLGTALLPGQVASDEILIVVQHQGKLYGQKE